MDRLENFKATYNWQEAFNFSEYHIDEVKDIIAEDEGCNDGTEWIGIFEMNDGKFVVLRAWCDYTGGDWKSAGYDEVFNTVDEAISKNSLSVIDIGRLGKQILSHNILVKDQIWKHVSIL